jgi:hypothetical protein
METDARVSHVRVCGCVCGCGCGCRAGTRLRCSALSSSCGRLRVSAPPPPPPAPLPVYPPVYPLTPQPPLRIFWVLMSLFGWPYRRDPPGPAAPADRLAPHCLPTAYAAERCARRAAPDPRGARGAQRCRRKPGGSPVFMRTRPAVVFWTSMVHCQRAHPAVLSIHTQTVRIHRLKRGKVDSEPVPGDLPADHAGAAGAAGAAGPALWNASDSAGMNAILDAVRTVCGGGRGG